MRPSVFNEFPDFETWYRQWEFAEDCMNLKKFARDGYHRAKIQHEQNRTAARNLLRRMMDDARYRFRMRQVTENKFIGDYTIDQLKEDIGLELAYGGWNE
ncbi:hypothetical protein N9L22_02160 [Candidatus Poseidonia alphae]|nr:hypothetical protein [Candidatus Poseidonia alphae]